MKKLSQLVEEAKKNEEVDDTIKVLSADELKKYKDVANKYLSDEGKEAIDWLIDHADYPKLIGEDGLALFMEKGLPKDDNLKGFYRNVKALIKKGRALEIPLFMTKDVFDDILSKKITPDEILLDLDTEEGRTKVTEEYNALVWKIVRSYQNKCGFSMDDLYGYAMEGLVLAMNTYGKSRQAGNKTWDGKLKDEDNNVIKTFKEYAGFCIRNNILLGLRNEGHMVRIPVSRQFEFIKGRGDSIKFNSKSIDEPIKGSKSKDGEGENNNLERYMKDAENETEVLDREDVSKSWEEVKKLMQEYVKSGKIKEKDFDIMCDWFGVFGHKKLSGKEMIDKYNLKSQSGINNATTRIFGLCKTDPKMKKLVDELKDLVRECLHDEDMRDNDYTMPLNIQRNEINEDDDE